MHLKLSIEDNMQQQSSIEIRVANFVANKKDDEDRLPTYEECVNSNNRRPS
jgi:hypothetical protein